MERRVMGNYHARCGSGEKAEIISKSYLSTSVGMLTADTPSLRKTMNELDFINKISVYIKGDLYDDNYIQLLPDDYKINSGKYDWENQ